MAVQEKIKRQKSEEMAILITISKGLIEQVQICKDSLPPVNIVSNFVQTMDTQDLNATFKGDDELLANCEQFLDGNYQFIKRFAD